MFSIYVQCKRFAPTLTFYHYSTQIKSYTTRGAMKMNATSSRSHTLLKLVIETKGAMQDTAATMCESLKYSV